MKSTAFCSFFVLTLTVACGSKSTDSVTDHSAASGVQAAGSGTGADATTSGDGSQLGAGAAPGADESANQAISPEMNGGGAAGTDIQIEPVVADVNIIMPDGLAPQQRDSSGSMLGGGTSLTLVEAPSSSNTGGAPPVGTEQNTSGSGGEAPVVVEPDMPPEPASPPPEPDMPVSGQTTVGGMCDSDADCLQGLFCLQDSEFFGGTIAHGTCTAHCEDDPTLCGDLDSGTDCFGTDTEAYCAELCSVGDGNAKCHSRLNEICLPVLGNGDGVCAPNCFDDLECPDGLVCDPGTGVCVDGPLTGDAFGAECSSDGACIGRYCADLSRQGGYCSALCTITGYVGGCGHDSSSSDPPAALCLAMNSGFSIGDPGLCVPTCDSDSDCIFSDMECVAFNDPDTLSSVGRNGICLPKL